MTRLANEVERSSGPRDLAKRAGRRSQASGRTGQAAFGSQIAAQSEATIPVPAGTGQGRAPPQRRADRSAEGSIMIDKRAQNPGDLVTYYSDLIIEERRKIAESMSAIAEYAERLRRVADDTERRLLTKD